MTAYVPTASIIGTSLVYSSVAVNDSVTFLQPYTFINTNTNAVNILHGNNTLLNMTTLMSGGTYGVVVNTVNDCDIINTATGTIATLAGFYGYSAIYLAGDRNSLLNAGNVYSINGTGLIVQGDDSVVDNSGTIRGLDSAIAAGGVDYTITNSGTIESGAAASSVAVSLAGVGAGKSLFNTGTIQSLAAEGGAAIRVLGHVLTTIINSGTIRSAGGIAIDADPATGGMHLTNSGAIISSTALLASVAGSSLADVIINTGTINRSVVLGDGDDVFNGIGGFVGGTVYGGDGNDTFRVSDALAQILEAVGEGTQDLVEASVSFSLAATGDVERLTLLGTARDGIGNAIGNIISGNNANNRLYGEGGLDALYGGAGDDFIDGGIDADSLYGGLGDDRLLGRGGVDVIEGNDGEDFLVGGGNGDTLSGGEGEDRLFGGTGRDTMTGGTESDTFIFRNANESGITTATRDIITDFEAGLDVLDLSLVDAISGMAGDQAFNFIGTAAFSGTAGQLRYYLSGSTLILQATLNNDTVADFSIRFNGEVALAVDDIWL